ncbi:putative methyltransferase-domain-containing protein [Melanogaster broomeanus]|nr:putative methyltransferase-domain-containing protein [Melanogaster broomeanus]
MDDEDGDLSLGAVFTEPPRPPSPEPTLATYSRGTAQPDVNIRLVGSHPLWGHHLWNAAIAFASYLDSNIDLIRDKFVLELGAGGGLPGIVAAQNDAKQVVLSDYPDAALVENLTHNVHQNISEDQRNKVTTQGYIWGQPVDNLFAALPPDRDPSRGFDLIILSDLIFNHSQHDSLLRSCEFCLTPIPGHSPKEDPPQTPSPCVLVFYTHHRPHLADRDLEFFAKARRRGWNCEYIYTKKFPPMFPDDPGDVGVRSTVHGWKVTRGTSASENE